MAVDFFAKDEDNQDEEQKKSGMVPLSSDRDVVTTGSQQQGQPGGTSSGSFTNLQSYLDANRDRNFGSEVAGKVKERADDAIKAQDTAEKGFRAAADEGAVDEDPGLLADAHNTPEKVTSSDDTTAKFFKMRDASYRGPDHLVDRDDLYRPAADTTGKAVDEVNLAQDEGGRKALLDRYYGSGQGRYDYTPGMQNLDNLLLQVDPTAKEAFAATKGAADAARDRFGTLTKSLDDYASQRRSDTSRTRADARAAVGIDDKGNVTADSPMNALVNSVQSRVGELKAAKDQDANQLTSALKAEQLTPEQLKRTGITDGMQLYGVHPGNPTYFESGMDPSIHNAATKAEQQREGAFSKLAGVENTFLPYADAAGTYDPSKVNQFDINRFLDDVKGGKSAYDTDLAADTEPYPEANVGNIMARQPLLDAIKRSQTYADQAIANQFQGKAGAPLIGGGIDWTPPVRQYESLKGKLRDLQDSHGFNQTINGRLPQGSWHDFEDLSKYLNSGK